MIGLLYTSVVSDSHYFPPSHNITCILRRRAENDYFTVTNQNASHFKQLTRNEYFLQLGQHGYSPLHTHTIVYAQYYGEKLETGGYTQYLLDKIRKGREYWKEPAMIQLPDNVRATKSHSMLLRALSSLNTDRLGAGTTSLGSLFQRSTAFLVKKCLIFIISYKKEGRRVYCLGQH